MKKENGLNIFIVFFSESSVLSVANHDFETHSKMEH
jgi:hypothetical protein